MSTIKLDSFVAGSGERELLSTANSQVLSEVLKNVIFDCTLEQSQVHIILFRPKNVSPEWFIYLLS
jgi:hypothetical protein